VVPFVADNMGMALIKRIDFDGNKELLAFADQSNYFFSSDSSEQYMVFYHARIYSKEKLKQQLAAKGVISRASCDGELIIDAYRVYGEKCVEHFEGVFSFVLLHREVIFAARDKIGQCAIYYFCDREVICLANSLKLILRTNLVDKVLDVEAIYSYLLMKAFEQPLTPIKGIRSLLPAQVFKYASGVTRVYSFWDLRLLFAQIVEEEKVETLSLKMLDILKKNLQDNIDDDSRPLGLLLSGGVDSCVLASLLKEISPNPLHSFTIYFDDNDPARYFGRLMAENKKINHHEILFSAEKLSDVFIDYLKGLDLPVANSGYMMYLVASLGKKYNISQYFCGEGADSIFGLNSAWQLFDRVDKSIAFSQRVPKSVRLCFLSFLRDRFAQLCAFSLTRKRKGVLFFYTYLTNKLGLFKWKGSTIDEKHLNKIFSDPPASFDPDVVAKGYRDMVAGLNLGQTSTQNTYLTLKTYQSNQQLPSFYSVSSHFEAEVSLPFLSLDMIRMCLCLPNNLKKDKFLLRRAMDSYLPRELAQKPSASFGIPFEKWIKHELKSFVDDVFSEETIKKRGLFDYKWMKKIHKQFLKGNYFVSEIDIWSFVVLEYWLRVHVDQANVPKLSEQQESLL